MFSKVYSASLLLLLVSTADVEGLCISTCTEYNQPSAITIFIGSVDSLEITKSQSNNSVLLSSNIINLYVSLDDCNDTESAVHTCDSFNVTEDGDGNFSLDFLCSESELQEYLGQNATLALVIEENGSNCSIFMDVFLVKPVPYVTALKFERKRQCIISVEGCFPPCCGSSDSIQKIVFGNARYYIPKAINTCSELSFSMSIGDSKTVHAQRDSYDNLLRIELTQTAAYLDLNVTSDDIDNLEICFRECMLTLDIGQSLMSEFSTLNYTNGCYNVNVSVSVEESFDMDRTTKIELSEYEAEFTYCEVIHDSNLNYSIACVGFNPADRDIQEKITLELSFFGECDRFIHNIEIGKPETVPCMDKRCQKISSFNLDYCLMICVNEVANDSDALNICNYIAEDALTGLLSLQNVTIIAEILSALANSSGKDQLIAFTTIMTELLEQLGQEENIHLVTITTGRKLLTVLDQVLQNDSDRSYTGQINFAPSTLEHLEIVANLLAKSLRRNVLSSSFSYSGNNSIVLLTVEKTQSEDFEDGQYTFPKNVQINPSVRMEIPLTLLCKESTDVYKGCSSVVATMIIKLLPQYLESVAPSERSQVNTHMLLTVIDGNEDFKDRILQDPIYLYFTPLQQALDFSNETCVYWNPVQKAWSSSGVQTYAGKDSKEIECRTTHLTSFAVLVDPASAESTAGRNALRVVSYIGCAISLACLLLSLLIFLIFGRALKKGVLLYIHINFVISLSLALAVFVVGIESATGYNWLCTLVAALLHYLFLSVFCWMLAEGLMLYMLVVRVFGTAAEKWYYLLLLGWGLPLPIVVISVAIRHEEYGTENYCWLSESHGTYWGFLGPMIVIILFNTAILIVTIGSMIRSRKKFAGSKDSSNWILVRTTVKSTVILLPLLGITWIIGPFALLKNTDTFAWMFAIFNSLQGLFFFLLHVLRNEKVFETMKKSLMCIPASVMEKNWSSRDLSSKNLASAESVTTGTDAVSQTDCERVTGPPFSIRIYDRKCSDGSTGSFTSSHNNI